MYEGHRNQVYEERSTPSAETLTKLLLNKFPNIHIRTLSILSCHLQQ